MEIVIEPRTTPVCSCGGSEWSVVRQIKSDSLLLRVDGLGDLLTQPPDPNRFSQLLALVCNGCGVSYQPQQGIEAWFEGGGEDGYGWPERTGND